MILKHYFHLNIYKVVLWFVLISPAMPKLKLAEGVTIYLHEIILIFASVVIFQKVKLRFQFILLAFWISILISTILSQMSNVDIGGLVRVFKGLIYIPLGYVGFRYLTNSRIHLMLRIFVIASVINMIIMAINVNTHGLNFWDVKSIAAGLSNRFIEIPSLNLGTIESGAHGIWGNYCVLLMTFAFYLRLTKQLRGRLFYTVIILGLVGIGITVSREAMITLFMVIIAVLLLGVPTKKNMIPKEIVKWSLLGIIILFAVVLTLGDQIPIIYKLVYTFDSFTSTGTEGNIQLRINGWKTYFEFLSRNPISIMTGVGFNTLNYADSVSFANNRIGFYFVKLPESFFMLGLAYGGIISFVCAIVFFKEIFWIVIKQKERVLRILILSFFIGLLIGNTLSGASIIADMLYGQVLLVLGFLHKKKNENITYNRSV